MIPNPTESTPLPLALQIDAYCRLFPGERERIAPLLRALHAGEALRSRKHPGGHLTASGLVFSRQRLLTVHHPHLRRWLQPGGHLERDELPQQAALRETREETGVGVRLHHWHARHPCPVDIDVHAIPANPARGEAEHLHFDLRYLLTPLAPPGPAAPDPCAPDTGGAELRTRWMARGELAEPGLHALLDKLDALHIDADDLP